jgi:Meiotically up-regulated gene 113
MIYFLLDPAEDAIKIGYTADEKSLTRRLKTFACANSSDLVLLHLEDGDQKKERRLHREWGNLRKDPRHEWFRNAGTLAGYLRRVATRKHQNQFLDSVASSDSR